MEICFVKRAFPCNNIDGYFIPTCPQAEVQNFPQNQKFPLPREIFFASVKLGFKKFPHPPGAQTEDSAPLSTGNALINF
jgi:hypothetical protein